MEITLTERAFQSQFISYNQNHDSYTMWQDLAARCMSLAGLVSTELTKSALRVSVVRSGSPTT